MSEKRQVLFLCTGNSARSIFGEYLLNRIGVGRFEAYSAGAQPTGVVNPFTIRVLEEIYHLDTSEARSKSWEEFKDVEFDLVITVCDNARESCPYWPGQPIVAHWGIPDPALATGSDEKKENSHCHGNSQRMVNKSAISVIELILGMNFA